MGPFIKLPNISKDEGTISYLCHYFSLLTATLKMRKLSVERFISSSKGPQVVRGRAHSGLGPAFKVQRITFCCGADRNLCSPIVLDNASLCSWCTVRPNKLKCQSLEQRKVYCSLCKERSGSWPPKTLNAPPHFSKASPEARWRRGVWSAVADFLVWESFVVAAVHSVSSECSCEPPVRQMFCNFLSLYEWKGVIPLKVRALRMGYPVYFRL